MLSTEQQPPGERPDPSDATAARRDWMALLARASTFELERLLGRQLVERRYTLPRPAEAGLCMVRGRVGGRGQRFNLGEMTVARCVVQLDDGTRGVAYVAGRERRRAELAALADALLQSGDLNQADLSPVAARLQAERAARAAAVATTRVDFFTLVRGED